MTAYMVRVWSNFFIWLDLDRWYYFDFFAGGDNISVTKGVVSRVEPTQYVHGATQLLAIQIDAAINPGNSGGPAIMGDKVAGVAFQNLSGAENIGWVSFVAFVYVFSFEPGKIFSLLIWPFLLLVTNFEASEMF